MGSSPELSLEENSKNDRAVPRHWSSYRIPLVVAVSSFSAGLLIWLVREIYLYWNNVRLVNFLAAWIPFVLSILVAFVPEHKMSIWKKILWRSAVIAAGFMWSAVLWHQQVVTELAAKEQQEGILAKAVTQSNQHSDQQIGVVRSDVQSVKTDVQGIKGDVLNINDAISKSTSTINESIGKVGKPAPPELARLHFSFYTEETDHSGMSGPTEVRVSDGPVVSVDIQVTAVGNVMAKNGQITLRICNSCEYAAEPEGFIKIPQHPSDRVMHFDQLYPNVYSPKITLKIIPPLDRRYNAFYVGGYYSCENCPPVDTKSGQSLRVVLARQVVVPHFLAKEIASESRK